MKQARILRLRDCFAPRSGHSAQDDSSLTMTIGSESLQRPPYFAAAAPASTSTNENASATLGYSLPATSTYG
jgi:hypothetical protein